MEPRLIWINLLVKLGVAAAVSSSLVRSKEFKSLLFREEREFRQKFYLVLWMALPIMVGEWIRFSAQSFLAGDLSFETALLLGVIGGRFAGSLGGLMLGIPAMLHGEWAALPFGVLCGFIAGQLRTMATDKDDIWSFSPFIDQSIFRLIRRNLPRPRLFDWQVMFFITIALFNTLNSISSLVRFDPDTARELISKLATILRRLLNSSESFVPLREEVEFIDNYLDIEVVRFGNDKLRVVKELDPASLDVMVPSMLLQPLVENSIKHGLSPLIEGGSIHLRSRLTDSRLVIEVEDDGVGMAATQPGSTRGAGIGMANISERLQMLYGNTARMTIDSGEGKGTLVRIRLPLLQASGAVPEAFYEERSSTRR